MPSGRQAGAALSSPHGSCEVEHHWVVISSPRERQFATQHGDALLGQRRFVRVPDIAEILSIPVADAEAALLQLLTLTTAFNTIMGRQTEADALDLGMLSAIGLSAEELR